jgi:ABC-type branched-subunit amino acid transport system ATPase component
MLKPVLQTVGVSKSFGGLLAVDNFTMEIYPGTIRGIIGPNGAGKTTIFNLISRIYVQDKGEIILDGINIDDANQIQVAKLGVSRTFQNTRLFTGLNVLDNVKVALDSSANYSLLSAIFGIGARKREEKRIERQTLDCLELLKLMKYAKKKPSGLPYGIQRRVEIARALVNNPKLLLLDEPAAGLNPEEVNQLLQYIKEIKVHYPNLAILVIEHRMELVMGLCDYIYVQDFGESIAQGSPEDIKKSPAVLAAYLGGEEIL